MYWPNLKSVALPVPEIISIGVWGDANLKSRERGVVVWNGTVQKSVVDFFGPP